VDCLPTKEIDKRPRTSEKESKSQRAVIPDGLEKLPPPNVFWEGSSWPPGHKLVGIRSSRVSTRGRLRAGIFFTAYTIILVPDLTPIWIKRHATGPKDSLLRFWIRSMFAFSLFDGSKREENKEVEHVGWGFTHAHDIIRLWSLLLTRTHEPFRFPHWVQKFLCAPFFGFCILLIKIKKSDWFSG